jgi:hypothetical protein
MRHYFVIVFLSFNLPNVSSQQKDTLTNPKNDSGNIVSFTTIFDKSNATKDGYYINEYVVELDYALAQKIDGKKIRITGKVHTVKGLNNQAKEYDSKGNEIMKQGRSEDKKHIASPTIEVLQE